ncbi:MAG: Cardiolipin synthetase, partial [uncultured Gemmatimonadetes bacterium]
DDLPDRGGELAAGRCGRARSGERARWPGAREGAGARGTGGRAGAPSVAAHVAGRGRAGGGGRRHPHPVLFGRRPARQHVRHRRARGGLARLSARRFRDGERTARARRKRAAAEERGRDLPGHPARHPRGPENGQLHGVRLGARPRERHGLRRAGGAGARGSARAPAAGRRGRHARAGRPDRRAQGRRRQRRLVPYLRLRQAHALPPPQPPPRHRHRRTGGLHGRRGRRRLLAGKSAHRRVARRDGRGSRRHRGKPAVGVRAGVGRHLRRDPAGLGLLSPGPGERRRRWRAPDLARERDRGAHQRGPPRGPVLLGHVPLRPAAPVHHQRVLRPGRGDLPRPGGPGPGGGRRADPASRRAQRRACRASRRPRRVPSAAGGGGAHLRVPARDDPRQDRRGGREVEHRRLREHGHPFARAEPGERPGDPGRGVRGGDGAGVSGRPGARGRDHAPGLEVASRVGPRGGAVLENVRGAAV